MQQITLASGDTKCKLFSTQQQHKPPIAQAQYGGISVDSPRDRDDTYWCHRPSLIVHERVESNVDQSNGQSNDNNHSCQSDGLPDAAECSPLSGHLNVAHMTGVVHSFMADRNSYCVVGQQMSNSTCRMSNALSMEQNIGAAVEQHGMAEVHPTLTSKRLCSASTSSSSSSSSSYSHKQFNTRDNDSVCKSRSDRVCESALGGGGCGQSVTSTLPPPASGVCGEYLATRATLARLNSVEPATAVFSTLHSPALVGLTSSQVIDALHAQLGTTSLRAVRSVRIDSGTVYLSMMSREALTLLLQKRSQRPLTLCGVPVELADISWRSVVLLLSGVPHYISDHSVRLMMASYGVVIGGVERRFYRAVDTGDRLVRLRRTSRFQLPRYVTVCGVRILVYMLRHDQLVHMLSPEQGVFQAFGQLCRLPGTNVDVDSGGDGGLACSALDRISPESFTLDQQLRRSHSADSGLIDRGQVDRKSVSPTMACTKLTSHSRRSSSLQINLQLQSEPDISRSVHHHMPSNELHSKQSDANFSEHIPDIESSRLSLSKLPYPSTTCWTEATASSPLEPEAEENIDAVLASYYSVASEPVSRRFPASNQADTGLVPNQTGMRRLRFTNLKPDSFPTTQYQSQEFAELNNSFYQTGDNTTDTNLPPTDHAKNIPEKNRFTHQIPNGVVVSTAQHGGYSGQVTRSDPTNRAETQEPGYDDQEDIEEEEWSYDDEQESDESDDVKDLPWCGCWGNGCF